MDRYLLYRFFNGQATEEEIARIRQWEQSSTDHATALKQERKLYDMMILARDTGAQGNHRIRPARYYWGVLATAAAALLLGVFLWLRPERTDSVNIAQNTISVPPGQHVNLRLPDGSDVWLNAGTTLTYPPAFKKEGREVFLDGEALFEVARNEKVPFIVKTYAKSVSVLGTRFDVDASRQRNTFRIALFNGKVRIDGQESDKPVFLSPGETASLDTDGRLAVTKTTHPEEYRWYEGLYCFNDKAFPEILRDLERYFDLEISLNNPDVKDIILTGKFRISDGPETALKVLQNSFPFQYTKDNNLITIY